jgi:short subunit dehydrogenase-like uncharacterized protein
VTFAHFCCQTLGESPWIKDIIDRYDAEADKKGILIVPSCGFDSVPSDLGVY